MRRQYAKRLRRHQSDRIRVLDWVSGEALDELPTNAMLFVLPSDLEGLSLALLDAVGAGVCVLASDIPENRELVDGSGFTFRRGDQDDLERVLRLLISEPEIRKAARQQGQGESVGALFVGPRGARDRRQLFSAGWGKAPEACLAQLQVQAGYHPQAHDHLGTKQPRSNWQLGFG